MSTRSNRDARRSSYYAPCKVGDVIDGKYELVRQAGKGSMGEVWVATHRTLRSQVAIKIINPEVLLPVIAERLMREARAAAMLNHPSIVRVFDLGETPGSGPFIVMELLEGESLGQRLTRVGRLSPEEAIAILLPIAGAMHAAHAHGVIHRDLKPDNIMLVPTDSGAIRPKLVDFGIAKLAWTEPDGTGAVMIGTPDYMSPEQAQGGDALDHRTDMWSFCVMLYELIAGEMPFDGDTTWQVLRSIVEEPAPSLAERSLVDPALWAIVERGLSKDPGDRWGSMRELGDALARWLVKRGVLEDVCGASLRVEWIENGTVDQVKDRITPTRRQTPRPLAGGGRRAGELEVIDVDLDTWVDVNFDSSVEVVDVDSGTGVWRRGTRVLGPGRRGRTLAIAAVVMGAAASLGALVLSQLDVNPSVLSLLPRAETTLAVPPASPSQVALAAPPAGAATAPARDDPEPTEPAAAPYPSGSVAPAMTSTSWAPARAPATQRTARQARSMGKPLTDDQPAPIEPIAPAPVPSPAPMAASRPAPIRPIAAPGPAPATPSAPPAPAPAMHGETLEPTSL